MYSEASLETAPELIEVSDKKLDERERNITLRFFIFFLLRREDFFLNYFGASAFSTCEKRGMGNGNQSNANEWRTYKSYNSSSMGPRPCASTCW